MELLNNLERFSLEDEEVRRGLFLKLILPEVLDDSILFFLVASFVNYFFWVVMSLIFAKDLTHAIGPFCFILFLFSLVHGAVRGAQAYSMLEFKLVRDGK